MHKNEAQKRTNLKTSILSSRNQTIIMKVICAGYPKTGSKSCSTALRELGFNVADLMETMEFLSADWRDYIRGDIAIEDVLAAYDREKFDTNQLKDINNLLEFKISEPDLSDTN